MSSAFDVLLSPTSTPQQKIEVIQQLTEQRLKALIKRDTVPAELDYIVTEVTLRRYNKIGLEGITSYSQEGLTEQFDMNDFEPFMDDINAWLDDNEEPMKTKYKVRFL